MSMAIIRICFLWFCLSVSLHDKTKTAETKIAKLGTGIVYHDPRPPINIRSRSQGHSAKWRLSVRHELCTLVSAQPIGLVNIKFDTRWSVLCIQCTSNLLIMLWIEHVMNSVILLISYRRFIIIGSVLTLNIKFYIHVNDFHYVCKRLSRFFS